MCATNQAYTLNPPYERERLQILPNIVRARWGYLEGVYGTPSHIRVRGQAVRVLYGWTLQA